MYAIQYLKVILFYKLQNKVECKNISIDIFNLIQINKYKFALKYIFK